MNWQEEWSQVIINGKPAFEIKMSEASARRFYERETGEPWPLLTEETLKELAIYAAEQVPVWKKRAEENDRGTSLWTCYMDLLRMWVNYEKAVLRLLEFQRATEDE